MPFLTVPEFYSLRLYELDDANFARIEGAYRRVLGDRYRNFLLRHLDKTVAEVCAANCVDARSALLVL